MVYGWLGGYIGGHILVPFHTEASEIKCTQWTQTLTSIVRQIRMHYQRPQLPKEICHIILYSTSLNGKKDCRFAGYVRIGSGLYFILFATPL